MAEEIKIASNFELVPVADLIPYARNSRTHSVQQVKQIAASIREFGFMAPCLIDKDNNIIAGHGRILAAQKLKMDKVPCVRAEHLTEVQRRAYILADNRIALSSGWDESLLKLEFEELKSNGFNLDLTGFSLDEINQTMKTAGEDSKGNGDPDEVPPPPKDPVTKRGDLWLLDPYFECEKCKKRYTYEEGLKLKECPCDSWDGEA